MIRAAVNLKVVDGYLSRLKLAKRQQLYLQAARAAAGPVRNELRKAWRAAKRRRSRVVRKIAAAQEIRVYRGQRGAQRGAASVAVGTNYKRGGSVKIWHLIERGFQHYGGGSNSVYKPKDRRAVDTQAREDAWAQSAHDAQLNTEVSNNTQSTKYGKQRLMQARVGARKAFRAQFPEDTKHRQAAYMIRQSNLKAARGGVVANRKRILGRHISEPIAMIWSKKIGRIAARHAEKLAWYQIDGKRGGSAKPNIAATIQDLA